MTANHPIPVYNRKKKQQARFMNKIVKDFLCVCLFLWFQCIKFFLRVSVVQLVEGSAFLKKKKMNVSALAPYSLWFGLMPV